ncbi:hypothetical protein O181_058916 [Austropuccinia psidii MF-1]|uniref:mRNA-capping enzyme subunit beta n=1 Tax=Austropuccinia psidii MF-1 TaxID=1389203 RepID=A0A9Q3EI07_9BASI|nr:hypothetical protein [Austropuccinia psidii MF-1]
MKSHPKIKSSPLQEHQQPPTKHSSTSLASLLNPISSSNNNHLDSSIDHHHHHHHHLLIDRTQDSTDPNPKPLKRQKKNSYNKISPNSSPNSIRNSDSKSPSPHLNSFQSILNPIQTKSPSNHFNLPLHQSNNSIHDPSISNSLDIQLDSANSISNIQSSSNPSSVESNLEESIFALAPYNDLTFFIAHFIWNHSKDYWQQGLGHLIEIEAKLGLLLDKSGNNLRMSYPIGCETPILETKNVYFQADMSINHHENLNRLLNQRVTETNLSSHIGPKVIYSHLKEIDEFHDKIRVSKDRSTNRPLKSIRKEKIANLNISCPGRPFDFRISVNVEHPAPMPNKNSKPTYQRIKDRLSYSHQICQIDLTQVKTNDQTPSTHELEVEFKDSNQILKAASLWFSNQDRKKNKSIDHPQNSNHDLESGEVYLLMVEVLLNNVRMLIRNCEN